MLKNLKKMLNYDQGGQVPGQSSSTDQPGIGNQQNQPGSEQTAPGAATQPGQSSQQQPAASPYAPTKTGSGFTNIQKYIGANSNNQLGQAVGQGVTNTAQQANQNINNAQQDFQNQSTAANQNTQANRDYINNTYSGIQGNAGVQAAGAVDPSAGSNPNYTPPSQDDVNKFQTFTSGQYTGPQALGNQQNLQTQATDVNNLQNSLNSFEGRQGLLQRFVGGNNNYTQGQQNLDALLLGQTGGQQLNQARLASQHLPDLNNLINADQGAAQTYQNQAQDLANFTKTGAQTAGANIQNSLTNQATAAQAASDARYNGIMSDLNAGALKMEDAAVVRNLLGLDPDSPIYGTKDQVMAAISGALQKGNAYTPSSIANQNQYASQQALQQLSGLSPTDLGLNIDQSKVGTGGTDFNVDQNVKQQLLNNQQQSKDKFLSDYKNAGILSQQELDYMNDPALKEQFGALGANLNNINNLEGDPFTQNLNNIAQEKQDIQNKLAAYDQSQGQSGFNKYNNDIAHIDNYGGGRSTYQGEGVSAFLANIAAQQEQREDLEKQGGYFNNLSSLLASQNNPPTGSNVSGS